MIRKLFQVGNIEDYNPDYDEEQAFYFETSHGAHEECKAQRQSGIDENARITVGFFITPDELTQIKKEAFEAARRGADGWNTSYQDIALYRTVQDYLKESIK